jgi:hypothetical protein
MKARRPSSSGSTTCGTRSSLHEASPGCFRGKSRKSAGTTGLPRHHAIGQPYPPDLRAADASTTSRFRTTIRFG